MKGVREPKYIFPEDIEALVEKEPEKKTETMRLFAAKGEENGEGRKSDDGQEGSAQGSI